MQINFKEKLKKWLSLSEIGFKKHPMGWILGNLGMILGLLELHKIFPFEDSVLFSSLSALALGVLLSIVIDLYKEHYHPPLKWFRPLTWFLLFGLISLFGFWCFKQYKGLTEVFWFQWWAFMSVALLLTFIAYKPNSKSIDQSFFFIGAISKSIFGGLFLGVLLATGLSAILFTLENLFEIKLPHKIWGDVWIVFALIMPFNFFLGLLDEELNIEYKEIRLNNILEKALIWVLPGLLFAYLLIILSYGLKILIEGVLPKGLVGGMVLGYLSVLFVALLGQILLNKKLNRFYRIFTLSSPLVVLLLAIALKVRIAEHGLTEGRFLWISLGLILFISILFIEKNPLRVIWRFVFMALLGAFLFGMGDWGFSGMVKQNQMTRLEHKLIEQEMLIEGKIKAPQKEIEWGAAYRLGANLTFILERYGIEAFETKLSDSLFKKLKPMSRYQIKTKFFEAFNIPEIHYWEYRNGSNVRNKVQDFSWNRAYANKGFEFEMNGPMSCKEIYKQREWNNKIKKTKVPLFSSKSLELNLDVLPIVKALDIKNNKSEFKGELSQKGFLNDKEWKLLIKNIDLYRSFGDSTYDINGVEGLFCIEK